MATTGELAGEGRADRLEQQVSRGTHSPTDDHHGRVEHRGQRGDALAEPAAQVGELLGRERVTGLRALGDHRAGDEGGVAAGAVEDRTRQEGSPGGRCPRLTDQGGATAVRLEAPVVAAAAQGAVGHHAHVPDLAAHAEAPSVQPAVEHHATPDAGADRDEQQVVDVLPRTEAELSPRGCVGVVLHDHRQGDAGLDLGAQVQVAPGQVGGEHHHRPRLVDVTGRTDADGLHLVTRTQLRDDARDRVLDGGDVRRRRDDPELLDDGSVLVHDAAQDLGTSHVDAAGEAHSWSSPSSGQSSVRSMRSTPVPRCWGTAVASSAVAAWASDVTAVARCSRTSGDADR